MSGDKDEVQYPECEKLAEASKESQSIGHFLEWLLDDKGYEVCEFKEEYEEETADGDPITVNLFTQREWYDDGHDEAADSGTYIRVPNPQKNGGSIIEGFLAEYFDIDMKKVEEERRAMLEVCAPE